MAMPRFWHLRTSGTKRSSMRSSSACVLVVGVFAHPEELLVGKVAGVDAHLLDVFGGLHGRGRD